MEQTKSFEEILDELRAIVQKLETEDTSLELSVKNFEKGMELVKKAEEILTLAQKKIEFIEVNQKNK